MLIHTCVLQAFQVFQQLSTERTEAQLQLEALLQYRLGNSARAAELYKQLLDVHKASVAPNAAYCCLV